MGESSGLCASPADGLSGEAVLNEVLAQLCLWRYTRTDESGAEYSEVWWDYVSALADCGAAGEEGYADCARLRWHSLVVHHPELMNF